MDVLQTEQYKKFEASQTPGSWLAGMRDAMGMSQKSLGQKLGGVSPARISDWENNRRAISKEYAKALAKVFGISVERFL
jgi:transcriptional regulator with XRE-family HTH domain